MSIEEILKEIDRRAGDLTDEERRVREELRIITYRRQELIALRSHITRDNAE